jgi:double-strand break repair protein AddB
LILRGVYTLPPGVNFPIELVSGLCDRLSDQPPQAMANVLLYLNTARMRREVEAAFVARGAMLLPRLRLITDLPQDPVLAVPSGIPPLRRRLELAQLVARLLDSQPDLAPRAAIFDLADSLAQLSDEMQGEGVSPDALARLDVSGHSEHWARTQQFLSIIAPHLVDEGTPDSGLRQRLAVERQIALWQADPPPYPVIIAGSTGSRGTTARLMEAVAGLPHGALVLPGFDADQPADAWAALDDALTAEDHPQFRYRQLGNRLGLEPAEFREWTARTAPNPDRNRLISLSMRPAPVTDRWLAEGPNLPDLLQATQDMTLIEAPTPRTEALAIALVLRQAADQGRSAALITPDRTLARQVTAALDRWRLVPDDSAGRPLALSAPGRFLLHVAELFGPRLTADRLLILLKHPLTASAGARGDHLRLTRELELRLRRHGPVFPTADDILHWAATLNAPTAADWAAFLARVLAASGADTAGTLPLADHVTRHVALAEVLARGTAPSGSGELWLKEAGQQALATITELADEASHGAPVTTSEYRDLFGAIMTRVEVRDTVQGHPRILLWGTLEARIQGADLVVLGGLNDGVWPQLPPPDPWLNRSMRKEAGLLLPERRIGLSAHDYQQAVAAPEVILTRATRDAEAECVPSRWINRLVNLMSGLPDRNGRLALAAMRDRGAGWLALAAQLETPTPGQLADPRLTPAKRPAPQPPVSQRPRRLALTAIARLIRDPYAIYARHVLRLYPLDPLHPAADARDRGNAFHLILERFVRERPAEESLAEARGRLLATAAQVLQQEVPFPAARTLWLARFSRATDHVLTQDRKRGGTALLIEEKGEIAVPGHDFTLFGTPDRIDRLPDGRLHLIDYKSGNPPTERQQAQYDKQLLLAAAMAERGGFAGIGPTEVAEISYVGLGAGEKAVETQITEGLTQKEWDKFVTLIDRYHQRATGYAARRAVFEDRIEGDYDHLSRLGEWQMSDRAAPAPVGPEDDA